MVVCAHLQRVYISCMLATQTTFCEHKRRLRKEPGSTAMTGCQAGNVTGTSAVVPANSNTVTPVVTAESSANTLASVFIPVIILILIRTF